MSYQVFARKYRPQRFCEVVGQIHVTQTLQNALAQGRVHHAYLFTGARGVGKTTVARILAKALNCKGRKAAYNNSRASGVEGEAPTALPLEGATRAPMITEPCDKCPCCLEVLEGKSLDVQEIDGASNTGVEDIRQIREQVKYLPAHGAWKIYIIDEVHMLSTSAFNALLKTLEEPPPHVVFVFATTEPHKIPATILSRCQRFDFKRLSVPDLSATLEKIAGEEGVALSREVASLIAHEAGGSLRDAESLLDQAIAFGGKTVTYEHLKQMLGFLDKQELWDLLKAILQKETKTALGQLDQLHQRGVDFSRLAQDLLTGLRHLLLLASLGEAPAWLDLPEEEKKICGELQALASPESLDILFQLAYRGFEEIGRSPFPKMAFEVLLVRMTRLPALASLEQILKKLETSPAGIPAPRQMSASQPSPAPTPAPKTAPGPGKNFADFSAWLQKEKPQLASILAHAKRSSLEGDSLSLVYEEGSFYGEMLKEEDRKNQFHELWKRFFGKETALKLHFETASSPAGGEKPDDKKRIREEALREEAVREAQNILGAVVEEIRTPEKQA